MGKWQDNYIPTCMLGYFLLHMEFSANKMFGGRGNNVDDNGEVYLNSQEGLAHAFWMLQNDIYWALYLEILENKK